MKRALAALALACAGCQILLGIDTDVAILDGGLGSDGSLVDGSLGGDGGTGGDGQSDGATNDAADAACPSGGCMPVEITTTTDLPSDIALDGQYVYWASIDGKIGRARLDGSDPETIVSGNSDPLAHVAVTSTRIFFCGDELPNVYVAYKDGGAAHLLYTLDNGRGVSGLTADDTSVFATANDPAQDGGVTLAPANAAGTTTTAQLFPSRQFDGQLASSTDTLFWEEGFNAVIQAGKSADAGAPIMLSNCTQNMGQIVPAGTYVVWAAQDDTSNQYDIFRTDVGVSITSGCAGPSRRVLSQDQGNRVYGVAVSGDRVLWTNSTQGTVKMTSLVNGCSGTACGTVIAQGQSKPTRMAANADTAYWIDETSKKVMLLKLQ